MGFLTPTATCPFCGAPVRLRSFRPPPNKCPHCGQLRDPYAVRENLGCLAFLPISVGTAAAFGYAGYFVGQLLAPAVNIPDLAPRLAFLVGADGFGISVVAYWRVIGGPNAERALAPYAVFLMFVLLGMKCGHGFGIASLLVSGLANGALCFFLTIPLLRRPTRPLPLGPADAGTPLSEDECSLTMKR